MASNIEEMRPARKLADPDRENWDIEDVAAYFDIHRDTVRSEARKGGIPAFKVGDKWRFKSAKIRAFEGRQGHAA